MRITKTQLRRIIREAAQPITREAALRSIVDEQTAARVDGRMVDLFTASAILSVLDGLNPANRERYLSMPIERMADIAIKIISKKN
jgi:hypothetical protein